MRGLPHPFYALKPPAKAAGGEGRDHARATASGQRDRVIQGIRPGRIADADGQRYLLAVVFDKLA